ncbi:DCC1-like thiol-disulfide oxidoreductase family protein [Lutimonas saemankumensis]|uniref:thiol-disulfide oxidoreductase DCC family protein n=1 Tax=Lutimonas saemankumensis TaxID=483016 RepID=UPI001CD6FE81|nr:DCC1-like thiol-disulfide oxidoreductase family protein [Lutimonas saemankumensis]MCA0932007.1 DCC1-like thiol-disulfide oxidoreductase family protein [Lutimonas saemankumensis]
MSDITQNPVILFDGVCNLCNRSVKFILKNESKPQFIFASLQSDAAKNILLHYNIKNINPSSILLLANNKVFDESDAVLEICRNLNRPWNMFTVFKYLPLSFRDAIYRLVARNRYKWFGKKDSCTMEINEYKNRFLQ